MGASSGARLGIAGDDRGPPRASRFEPREGDVQRGGEGERGQRRADREGEEKDHEVQDHAGTPARERGPPPSRRRIEELSGGVGAPSHDERIGDHDPEERDENPTDGEQEVVVSPAKGLPVPLEHAGRREGDRGDADDEGELSPPGSDVLDRDGGRVDVRETVVRLVDEDEEEGEAGEAEGCDPREDVRPARADDQSSPEEEEQDVREEVPQDSRRGAGPYGAGAPIVVRDQGPPGDRHRDHEVEAEEEAGRPEVPCGGGAGIYVEARDEQPIRDQGRGEEDQPDRELLDPVPDDDQRAADREDAADEAEHGDPRVRRRFPQERAGDRGRGEAHDEELERGPSEELDRVQRGGDIRASTAEDRAEADHRRHAVGTPEDSARTEEHAPDGRARDGDREGLPQVQPEEEEQVRTRDEHEEADPEARPQDEQVERPQDAEGFRDRLDAPLRWAAETDHRSLNRG